MSDYLILSDFQPMPNLPVPTNEYERELNFILENYFRQIENALTNYESITSITGPLTVGSSTDYTEISTDGTIGLNGNATVWDDFNFDPDRSGGPVATRPDEVTINNNYYSEFTSSNNQICGSAEELPHNYKLSSKLYPHIHIFLKSGESAGTTGVTFTLYYQVRQDGLTSTGSTTLSATSAQLSSSSGGTLLTIYEATGFNGGTSLGAQLALTIARTGGNAGDVVVTTYGVHYEIDSIGSKEENVK